VVDATFLKRGQRSTFMSMAARLRVPLVILDCPVTLEVAQSRIAKRKMTGNDPSEADKMVLLDQWRNQEPLHQEEEAVQLVGNDLNLVEEELRHRLPGAFKTTQPPLPQRD
jgi:predicted kinase